MYNKDWLAQYKKNGEPKFEANQQAAKALFQALGVSIDRKSNGIKNQHWTVCHIWGIDDPTFQRPNSIVQNPMYYSNIGNMVLFPSPVKAFTDCVPEIKMHLRVCAWYLYGFICEELKEEAEKIKEGYIPIDYPKEWPRSYREKLPPGTVEYNPRIQNFIANRKRQIRQDLNNPRFEGSYYPKERISNVLNVFPGNEPEWWRR